MSDDLDLRGIDQRHEPDPVFRAALHRRLVAIMEGTDLADVAEPTDAKTIELEPASGRAEPRRRNRWITRGAIAIASAAAIVATIAVVISRGDTTGPADVPSPSVTVDGPPAVDRGFATVLEEPSEDESARANDTATYGAAAATEVTGARTFVSLSCYGVLDCGEVYRNVDSSVGSRGWAYVVGSADSPDVHAGLLGNAEQLVLSALDDRFFVASEPSSSQDPQATPAAWLIDSVTGQRGALTWHDEPTTLTSPEQALVLVPAQNSLLLEPVGRFLPRVVDRRDGTIRPLTVPEQASAALVIQQSGSHRVWVGTAPDGGDAGLAYSDDGGASWTDVELPESLRPTSEDLLRAAADDPTFIDELLTVAATGDHVAVAAGVCASECADGRLFTSADAGETWDAIPRNGGENVRYLFVQNDRLVYALNVDVYVTRVFASTTTSDWSQLEMIENCCESQHAFVVGQRGVAQLYSFERRSWTFSTDLSDWWSIPSIPIPIHPNEIPYIPTPSYPNEIGD